MTKKLLVVRYDCEGLTVLPECDLDGEYTYAALSPRRDSFRVFNDAELEANLGAGSERLAAQIGQDRWNGKALDLSVAIGGRKSTVRRVASRTELRGNCDGASHFVRSALLGAFTLVQVPRAAPFTKEYEFEGQAGGAVKRRDGSPQDCQRTQLDAPSAPTGCSSPIRLELVPLGEIALDASLDAEEQASDCPSGTRLTDNGKCVAAGERFAEPYMCAFQDSEDCQRQCRRGSMASCSILARSYETGRGVPVDAAQAESLYELACEHGVAPACGRVGALLVARGERERGQALLLKSCSAGWTTACEISAAVVIKWGGAISPAALLKRSCDGGSAEGCYGFALLLQEGHFVPKSQAEAVRYLKLACDGGARLGCSAYATALEVGAGTVADASAALAVLEHSCDRGDSSSCSALSLYYFLGKHVTQNIPLGMQLLERACEGTDPGSCLVAGMRYANGVGAPRDLTKAARYLGRACDAGIINACTALQANRKEQ